MIDYLAARGRRKIGLVESGAWFERRGSAAEFEDLLAEYGMRSESRWQQLEDPKNPRAIRNLAELLATDSNGPDALILHDDNAVQEAIDGIQAAGKRVPEDIELVAWGNFPWHEQYSAPVKRFGVDMWQFVRRAKRYIDAHRRGENPEPAIELDTIDDAEAMKRGSVDDNGRRERITTSEHLNRPPFSSSAFVDRNGQSCREASCQL
jgi:DNA-binding LacI/PurR family transcriptional regulator